MPSYSTEPEDARPGERCWRHPQARSIHLRASIADSDLRVEFAPVDRATLTVSSNPADEDGAEALEQASVATDGSNMFLTLPASSGNGSTVNVSGVNGTSIVVSSGSVYINGRRVQGAGAANLKARAVLPYGSSLTVRATSGDVKTTGPGQELEIFTSAGSIRVEQARIASLSASSGSIKVERAGTLDVGTSSGSIRIGVVGALTARASSGSIRVEEAQDTAYARTSSGSVTIGFSGPVVPQVHTSSGGRRIHRVAPSVQHAAPTAARPEPQDAIPPGYPPRRPTGRT